MSFRIPHHAKLIAAHTAMAALVSQAILVDRHLEYESDDQGGRHAITGLSLSLVDGPADASPVIIFDRTDATSLPYFSKEDRASIAAMLGCAEDKLMEPRNAPAFFEELDRLRFGLMLSCIHEPYEIDPVGVPT